MSEKSYPCPLACVVLYEAHALPFDRYVGPILLLLALLQRTLTWFFTMCHPCDHLCEGRKGSPQATTGPFSGSAFVACPAAKQKKNNTNQVACSWAASPAPTSTPPPPPNVRIPLRLMRQYAIICSPSACLCASLARESMGEVGHKIK